MQNRQVLKEACYSKLEVDFTYIGATAIEDKLQRGVPDTIGQLTRYVCVCSWYWCVVCCVLLRMSPPPPFPFSLHSAGIRFWMCTGDKFSTALTISQTCNLKPRSNLLIPVEGYNVSDVASSLRTGIITAKTNGFIGRTQGAGAGSGSGRGGSAKSSVSVAGSAYGVRGPNGGTPAMTVIIRGKTLEVALEHCLTELSQLTLAATSVVCCRVTPKQKAELVKIVKQAGFLTLAIGDGGNDVSMIQEAHVGVGIRGKEGLQASRAADYVVVQFMTLQRLLLVHGRYSYYRTSLVAQYSFYKSFAFCFMQILYGFYSGFSGVSLFNSLCVAAYNALLFVPVVFFFVDKDVPEEYAMAHPEKYVVTQTGSYMTLRTMGLWFIRALVQAVLMTTMGLAIAKNSESDPYEVLGLMLFTTYLFVQDFTMLFELTCVTVYNIVSIFGLHMFANVAGVAMNRLGTASSLIDTGSFDATLNDPVFYFGNVLLIVLALLPVSAVRWYLQFFGWPFADYHRRRAAAANDSKPLPSRHSRHASSSAAGGGSAGARNGGGVETMNPFPSNASNSDSRRGSGFLLQNPSLSNPSARHALNSAAKAPRGDEGKASVASPSSVPPRPPPV